MCFLLSKAFSPPAIFVMSPSAEEARWFAEVVQPHDAELRGFVRRHFPAIDDVDDLLQETYARVWRARLIRPIESPRSFLFSIVRNLAYDHHRRRRGIVLGPITETAAARVFDDGPSAAEHASQAQEREILLAAVSALPDRCREVILLRYMDGLSYKEIATKMNISPETVKVHVTKGVQRCQAFFQSCGSERKTR